MKIAKQSGIAIITVMLIIALMVTLLGFLLEQQHLLMRRLGNQFVAEQGFQYAIGVEEWAMRVLYDDNDRIVDYLDEDWAKFGRPEDKEDEQSRQRFSLQSSSAKEEKPLPKIDFGLETLSFKIEDLQAYYNLNNLSVKNPETLNAQKTIFSNLLRLLQLDDVEQREEITAALIDWMDVNKAGTLLNAESPFYQSKDVPYYAADQKLTSLGELRYVEGFSADIINELAPYVTVLPVDNARVNINTTSAEVMASLNSNNAELDIGSVTAFLAQREDDAFLGFQPNQLQDAQTAIIGAVPAGGGFIPNMLQTNSQFFKITTRVVLGDSPYCTYTTVFRALPTNASEADAKISILNRQYDTTCNEIIR